MRNQAATAAGYSVPKLVYDGNEMQDDAGDRAFKDFHAWLDTKMDADQVKAYKRPNMFVSPAILKAIGQMSLFALWLSNVKKFVTLDVANDQEAIAKVHSDLENCQPNQGIKQVRMSFIVADKNGDPINVLVPVVQEPWLMFGDYGKLDEELQEKMTVVAIMHLFLCDADARMRNPDSKLRNLFSKVHARLVECTSTYPGVGTGYEAIRNMDYETLTGLLYACFENKKGISALMSSGFYQLADMKEFLTADLTKIRSRVYSDQYQQVPQQQQNQFMAPP